MERCGRMFRNVFLRSAAVILGSGTVLLSLLAGPLLSASAQDRQEDDRWYYGTSSDLGNGTFDNDAAVDSDVPDPEIIRVGDAYYMSSTSMHFSPGVPIMKSYDLVNWKVVNYVYNVLDDNDQIAMRNGKYDYGNGSWATSLKYREYDRHYYLSHTSNTTGKTYFYRTDDIENGVWERVSVCDSFYHDASMVFVGEDIYMFHGSGSINISKLKSDFSGEEWSRQIINSEMTSEIAREFTGDPTASNTFLEATHAYYIAEKYYVFMSGWPSGLSKTQYVFQCDEPDGNYEGKIIISDSYGRGEGIAQGGIVQMKDGNWMGFFMHNRGAAGRGMVLTPCTFDEEGWPVVADENGKIQDKVMNVPVDTSQLADAQDCKDWSIVTDTDFDNDLPRPAYTRQDMPDNVVEQERYAYNGSNLPLGFEWNHNPDNRYWSMTAREGYLRLINSELVPGGYTTAAKNTLTARTYGPESWGSVAMEIDGMKNGDVAGFGTFNRSYGYCGVKMENGKKYIIYRARKGDDQSNPPYTNSDEWMEDELQELDDSISRVYFMVYNDYTNYSGGEYAHFYYSTDGKEWVNPEKSRKVEFGYPTHFVGSRFGIFSFATEETGGYVDVDYFKLGNVSPAPLDSQYEPLGETIRRLESLQQEDYTDSSWEECLSVWKMAKDIYDAQAGDEIEYESANQSLRTAIRNLIPKNSEELRACLEEARTVNTFDWSVEDITALDAAIEQAQTLIDRGSNNERDLAEALEALRTAMSARALSRSAVAANISPSGMEDPIWDILSSLPVNISLNQSSVTGTAKLLWDMEKLYAYVQVTDGTKDVGDAVTVYAAGHTATAERIMAEETTDGYSVMLELDLSELDLTVGKILAVDIQIQDAGIVAARWYSKEENTLYGGPVTLKSGDTWMLSRLLEELASKDTSSNVKLEDAMTEARNLLKQEDPGQDQVLEVYCRIKDAMTDSGNMIYLTNLPEGWEQGAPKGAEISFGEDGMEVIPGGGDYPDCSYVLQKTEPLEGDWTVILEAGADQAYSGEDWKQYGLALYRDNDNWVKMVQCGAFNNSQIQFKYNSADGQSQDPGTKEFNSEKIWMKLVKKGNELTGYTSADGEVFDLYTTFTLGENMDDAKLQIYATTGFGSNPVKTVFESVVVAENQENVKTDTLAQLLDEAESLNAEFYESGWEDLETAMIRARRVLANELSDQEAINGAQKALETAIEGLEDGAVHFETSLPDQWEMINQSQENVVQYTKEGAFVPLLSGDYPASQNIFQYAENMKGDWTVTTCIVLNQELTSSWQQTGFGLYLDENNWVKLVKVSDMGNNPSVQFNYKKNGSTDGGGDLGTRSFPGTEVWLQLEKEGNVLTGRYSSDGKTYSVFGTHTLESNMDEAKLQVYASGGFDDRVDITACVKLVKIQNKETTAQSYKITFDSRGGSPVDSVEVLAGQTAAVPESPEKEGFHFAGWCFDQEGFGMYDFDNLVTGDITLYARWLDASAENCTITFDSGGGTGEMPEITVDKGTDYVLPECNFTGPDGKEFRAWSVAGEEKAAGSIITVNENILVTALWEVISISDNPGDDSPSGGSEDTESIPSAEDKLIEDALSSETSDTDKSETVPRTGDSKELGIWIILATGSAAACVIAHRKRKQIV